MLLSEDFPGSLYGGSPPPPDQEALDQAIEEHAVDQPEPPTAEEVIDETSGQALRDIQAAEGERQRADDEKRAAEAAKDIHPDIDEQ